MIIYVATSWTKENISEKFLQLSSSLSFDKSCVEDKDIKSFVNTSLHKPTFELNLISYFFKCPSEKIRRTWSSWFLMNEKKLKKDICSLLLLMIIMILMKTKTGN